MSDFAAGTCIGGLNMSTWKGQIVTGTLVKTTASLWTIIYSQVGKWFGNLQAILGFLSVDMIMSLFVGAYNGNCVFYLMTFDENVSMSQISDSNPYSGVELRP